MSDPLRVALVGEGPIDLIVIRAAISHILGGPPFVSVQLQPEVSRIVLKPKGVPQNRELQSFWISWIARTASNPTNSTTRGSQTLSPLATLGTACRSAIAFQYSLYYLHLGIQ